MLLSALLLSAFFFGLGLMVGRWTALPKSTPQAASNIPPQITSTTTPASQPATPPAANTASETQSDETTARHYALLVATYDAPEKARALIKTLQEAGYTDARTSSPRANETRPRYSVLVGRFTQDEAREAARRMRSTDDPRLKNAKVIESSGQ
jgi:cell division septation protein DedD